MACYYYITTSIVIEYVSTDGRYCTITTDTTREKRELSIPREHFGYTLDTPNKINDYIIDMLLHNSYKEILFKNSVWVTEVHKTQFANKYLHTFPHIKKIIKVFKNVHASKYV
jgi:hypothetical protein